MSNMDMRDATKTGVEKINAQRYGGANNGQFAIAYAILYGLRMVAAAIYATAR